MKDGQRMTLTDFLDGIHVSTHLSTDFDKPVMVMVDSSSKHLPSF